LGRRCVWEGGEAECYFSLCGIAFVEKMEALKGDALGWFSGGNIAIEISGEELKVALMVRFQALSE